MTLTCSSNRREYAHTVKVLGAAVLALVTLASVCQAKLGDTMDQCIARWGQPLTGSDPREPYFRVNDYNFKITFWKGVVAEESIYEVHNHPRLQLSNGEIVSDKEIETLLESESDGKKWLATYSDEYGQRWQREDGNVFAWYDPTGPFMSFESKSYQLMLREHADKWWENENIKIKRRTWMVLESVGAVLVLVAALLSRMFGKEESPSSASVLMRLGFWVCWACVVEAVVMGVLAVFGDWWSHPYSAFSATGFFLTIAAFNGLMLLSIVCKKKKQRKLVLLGVWTLTCGGLIFIACCVLGLGHIQR